MLSPLVTNNPLIDWTRRVALCKRLSVKMVEFKDFFACLIVGLGPEGALLFAGVVENLVESPWGGLPHSHRDH